MAVRLTWQTTPAKSPVNASQTTIGPREDESVKVYGAKPSLNVKLAQ